MWLQYLQNVAKPGAMYTGDGNSFFSAVVFTEHKEKRISVSQGKCHLM